MILILTRPVTGLRGVGFGPKHIIGALVNLSMYENHTSWTLFHFMGLGTPLHKAAELGKVDMVPYSISKRIQPHSQRCELPFGLGVCANFGSVASHHGV
jgi:hypothetical protein